MSSTGHKIIRYVTMGPIFIVLALCIIIISDSTAVADSYRSPWNVFLSMQAGNKELESKWPETNQDIECLSINIPYDLYDEAEEHRKAFLSFSIDLMRAREADRGASNAFYSREAHLGVRQTMNFKRINIYWGGGPAWVRVDAGPENPLARISGEDSALGYWAVIGFDILMPQYRGDDIITMGINAKYVDVELEKMGVNGGGTYFSFSLGLAIY